MVKKTTPRSFRHIWSVLCRFASIDKESNSLSLFNMIEELTITETDNNGKEEKVIGTEGKMVVVSLEFAIVTFLERLDGKNQEAMTKEAQIEIVDSSTRSLLKQEFEINFPSGPRRMRHVLKMNGFHVTIAGTYKFYISMRESRDDPFEKVAEIPVDVKMRYVSPRKKDTQT